MKSILKAGNRSKKHLPTKVQKAFKRLKIESTYQFGKFPCSRIRISNKDPDPLQPDQY
jgi:hypothetical protein